MTFYAAPPESHLFGFRRGSFTGAVESNKGIIASAERGTLFLDEIGDLPSEVQPKLLRFLDSMEIHPLGEERPRRIATRVIAATNADLDKMVEQGRFRPDLFYLLNVVRFRLPALRERRQDIPALVRLFLSRFSVESGKVGVQVAEDTLEHLLLYSWPGSVRQLAHEMERMLAFAQSCTVLRPEHLSPEIRLD